MRLDLVARDEPGRLRDVLTALGAVAVALLAGGVLVAMLGRSPVAAAKAYLVEPLSQEWGLVEIAVKATPLLLIAIGLSFCFRANRWNIGAEGQFVMGGLFGGWLAIAAPPDAQGWWLLPAMLLAGTAAGALYGLVPAALRNRFGVSEILSSLMLVYIAELLLDYMVRGPLRDPKGFNFPQSVAFPDAATLPTFDSTGRLHLGVLFALLATAVAAFIFGRTRFGFALRASGEAPRAAGFAGFDEKRITLAAFAISGGLAGLAGIVEVAGQIGQLKPTISPGYGFTAIIVAFLGRLSPPGMLLASFALAVISIGSENAQIALKLPLDLTRVFQGVLLFAVLGADVMARYTLRWRWR